MAKVVNLREARKARERAEKRAQGDANAAKFGRTKAEREQEAARAEKARAFIDGHGREAGIRPATAADLPAALAVIHAALRETVAAHYPPEIIARRIAGFDLARLERLAAEARLLVATRGERVVGFGGWDGTRLRTLFLAPEAQGGGLGRRMVAALIPPGAPARLTAQLGARGFYERLGFRVTAEQEEEGEVTLLMERPAPGAP